MDKRKRTTWLGYMEAFRDKQPSTGVFKPESIENFLQINRHSVFESSIPIIYLLDYTTGRYLTMSKSIKNLVGYNPSEFENGGVGFTLENYHREDLQLFSNQIFPERVSLLRSIPPAEHANYLFSYNFRFMNKQKEYVNVLQRNCFIKSDEKGNPLMSLGMIMSIEHFKSTNPVIETVDRLSPGDVSTTNISRKAYYLNDENKLFTAREKEVLLWTSEGLTSKEVANRLNISENTIINHRRNMQMKTNTRNIVELVTFAIRNGVI